MVHCNVGIPDWKFLPRSQKKARQMTLPLWLVAKVWFVQVSHTEVVCACMQACMSICSLSLEENITQWSCQWFHTWKQKWTIVFFGSTDTIFFSVEANPWLTGWSFFLNHMQLWQLSVSSTQTCSEHRFKRGRCTLTRQTENNNNHSCSCAVQAIVSDPMCDSSQCDKKKFMKTVSWCKETSSTIPEVLIFLFPASQNQVATVKQALCQEQQICS